MKELSGKYAVVTGAGSGIGRALALQLVSLGCHVAICDILDEPLRQTLALCEAKKVTAVKVVGLNCDVSDVAQVTDFQLFVEAQFGVGHLNLLVNNAGITGGGSFVNSPQQEWERTFNICWNGVYLMTRSFMPMLMASDEGHVVNMSSANGIRAVLGGHIPHTAYSTAKFAIRGFSESLIHDFRFNAPHLSVSVVMPGHTGTEILLNSHEVLGHNAPEDWNEDEAQDARIRWRIAGNKKAGELNDEQVREAGKAEVNQMRDLGMPPSEVAAIIIEGVQSKQWRILIGDDTLTLDQLVRESPNESYNEDFVDRWRLRTKALKDDKATE